MSFNMFSMFDPNTMFQSFNFLLFNLIYFMNYKFWKTNNSMKSFLMLMNKSTNIFFYSILMMLLMINLMNLIPLMFAISHNIVLTLNLTLNLWLTIMIFSFMNNLNILFMNFSPKMTMLNMIMIINLIELNSLMFLILSLSMRLMINMMMGHIIIFMMKKKMIIMIYLLIELFIIFIQSYVFYILNSINLNNMN